MSDHLLSLCPTLKLFKKQEKGLKTFHWKELRKLADCAQKYDRSDDTYKHVCKNYLDEGDWAIKYHVDEIVDAADVAKQMEVHREVAKAFSGFSTNEKNIAK